MTPHELDHEAVFAATPSPYLVLSSDLVIRDVNAACTRATGRRREELVGRPLFDAYPAAPDGADSDARDVLRASLERVRDTGRADSLGVHRFDVRDPDTGLLSPRYWSPVTVPVLDDDGDTVLLLHRADDVTDLVLGDGRTPRGTVAVGDRLREALPGLLARARELEAVNRELREARDELSYRALHDPLTGLLVRSVFTEQLARALSRLDRRPHPVAVLFVDLDRLKHVNDTHGHAAGDELLRLVAARLRDSVRPSDAVARMGGDEFVVLLDDLSDAKEAETVAERLLDDVSQPCALPAGPVVHPTASVGVAVAEAADTTADALLSNADTAMYAAKHAGRGRVQRFDDQLHTTASARRRLEEELATALADQQLRLHFQPIVHLGSGGIHAVEALLRWEHPVRGLVSAGEFIEVAEDSGLVVSLGTWVVREACRQLAAWDATLGERAPQRVFVNLSVAELTRPKLDEHVAACAAAAGVDPTRLVLEITERGVATELATVRGAIDVLQGLGCDLAIDDFGTGYSSLTRLVQLPAGILKIDRSFVSRVHCDKESAAIVSAVLLLAHNLQKTVVAEGVEDAAALEALRDLGCEYAQGYHLARPQSAATLAALLGGRT